MGQYYRIYLEKENGEKDIWKTDVDGEFHGQKLMEFSWCRSPFTASLTKALYRNPTKVVTLGDYAKETDAEWVKTIYPMVWGDENIAHGIKSDVMPLDEKYIVNHTKKSYIDFSEYEKKSNALSYDEDHIVYPITILTSVGNGRGGGDYYGTWMINVGKWAMDVISVEDEVPEGYTRDGTFFVEGDF